MDIKTTTQGIREKITIRSACMCDFFLHVNNAMCQYDEYSVSICVNIYEYSVGSNLKTLKKMKFFAIMKCYTCINTFTNFIQTIHTLIKKFVLLNTHAKLHQIIKMKNKIV